MYNEKTEEVRTTVASVTGKVFIGYIKAGFKPICDIRGGFITVRINHRFNVVYTLLYPVFFFAFFFLNKVTILCRN